MKHKRCFIADEIPSFKILSLFNGYGLQHKSSLVSSRNFSKNIFKRKVFVATSRI